MVIITMIIAYFIRAMITFLILGFIALIIGIIICNSIALCAAGLSILVSVWRKKKVHKVLLGIKVYNITLYGLIGFALGFYNGSDSTDIIRRITSPLCGTAAGILWGIFAAIMMMRLFNWITKK